MIIFVRLLCVTETYGLDFGAEDSPPISKLYGDLRKYGGEING